ncbi:MAG: YicC family protein [Gammaproteobacteria bacterium]|nr:YicC family protein [Gammaproteobacteria bacterium]
MIASMTAFAKQQQQYEGATIMWEIRSVNSRYLDVHFHMPDHFRELEMSLKQTLQQYISRGKIDCTLHYQSDDLFNEDFIVNQKLVKKLKISVGVIKNIFGGQEILNPIDVLRWPGVIQMIRTENMEIKDIIVRLFEKSLLKLQKVRRQEGKSLSKTIQERLKEIQKQIQKAEKVLPDIMTAQRQRFLDRFDEIKKELDLNRLEQEMLILAQKMDISEEIDRLKIHVQETKKLLIEGEVVGRQLDFIMQELNREANTLGSKAADYAITQVAVELKVLIEQMREQIQNIE